MSDLKSALYVGQVTHERLAPKKHSLRYSIFQILFDIDGLPQMDRCLRLLSYNKYNIFSFFDKDHGDGGSNLLRNYVEEVLSQADLALNGGRIFLLCMPRMFGHVFNPLSIYYCYSENNKLLAMIYEVNNTFGQTHTYLIPAVERADGGVRQSCAKGFYVSPFMDMEMTYNFDVSAPGDTIATTISGRARDGAPMIFAAFRGARRELSDRTLLGALFAYPFLTLGVVAAIHWEALKLIAKGMRLRRRPRPPDAAVTVVRPPAPALR